MSQQVYIHYMLLLIMLCSAVYGHRSNNEYYCIMYMCACSTLHQQYHACMHISWMLILVVQQQDV